MLELSPSHSFKIVFLIFCLSSYPELLADFVPCQGMIVDVLQWFSVVSRAFRNWDAGRRQELHAVLSLPHSAQDAGYGAKRPKGGDATEL